MGRVTYSQPFRLYDSGGSQVSFTTHHRLPKPSTLCWCLHLLPGPECYLPLPNQSRDGCNLGLMSSEENMNQTAGSLMAVEFDADQNAWDLEYDHVCINVNFLKSIYRASEYSLDVKFSDFTGNDELAELGYLHQIICLIQKLTEWLTFSFSASTRTFTELHKVLSWDFKATFLASQIMKLWKRCRRVNPRSMLPQVKQWKNLLVCYKVLCWIGHLVRHLPGHCSVDIFEEEKRGKRWQGQLRVFILDWWWIQEGSGTKEVYICRTGLSYQPFQQERQAEQAWIR